MRLPYPQLECVIRRVGKHINGDLVQGFLYEDGLRPIAELDGNNNVFSRSIYAYEGQLRHPGV
jgi:hypothetical protein